MFGNKLYIPILSLFISRNKERELGYIAKPDKIDWKLVVHVQEGLNIDI